MIRIIAAGIVVFAGLAGSCLAAGPTVTGPAGLVLQRLYPEAPFFERMLTNSRLNLRLYLTNGTGRALTYSGGTAEFRDASGALMRTAPLSVEEFQRRSQLLGNGGFSGGMVLTDINSLSGERAVAGVLDTAGRILMVGSGKDDAGQPRIALARYLASGSLDGGFSGDGKALGDPGRAEAVAVNAQGFIFVLGTLPSERGFVLRSLDDGGDSRWMREHEFAGLARPTCVAVDSVGRVVVGGYRSVSGRIRPFLMRFRSDAVLDRSFGAGGIVDPTFPGSTQDGITAVAIDATDRVVAAGWATLAGGSEFAVWRFRADNGGPDPTFRADGNASTGFTGFDGATARTVEISPSGRILLGGEVRSSGVPRMAVARFNTDGTMDANFSTDGRVVVSLSTGAEMVSDLTLDSVGRILLTGRAWNEEEEKIAVVRLNGIGQLDTSLAGSGVLFASGPEDWVSVSGRTVLSLPDDDIVVVGHAEKTEASGTTVFAMGRYRPSGSGAVLAAGVTDVLDLLDFPFYGAEPGQDYEDFLAQMRGFDSKSIPSQLDVTLRFLEFPEPLFIRGIPLAVFEQNAVSLRIPLRVAPTASWRPNENRIYGSPHAASSSQRFSYDFGLTVRLDPRCDPEALGLPELYESLNHPGFDPLAEYEPADFSECYFEYGEPIVAAADGTVVCVTDPSPDNFPKGEGNTSGNSVIIQHDSREFMQYSHMARDSVLVKRGDKVVAGQRIGSLGNSGSSTGPHLHMHYIRLNTGQQQLFCSGEGDNAVSGMPTYFNNVLFPSRPGGPAVRQLRSAIPPFMPFAVDTNAIPFRSIVLLHGPGSVFEVPVHDTLASPMHVQTPVTVRGSVSRGTGTSVADAGDTIEDIYRFTVPRTAVVSAQLRWNGAADLDMILYDQTLQPVSPGAAKTRSHPEILCLPLSAGTYYLFVTHYDGAPGPAFADYQLDLAVQENGRDIYIDRSSTCLFPFGLVSCTQDWGGPFPTVGRGLEALCPPSRLFIRGGTYAESAVLRSPMIVRSYNGTAVINP